MIARRSATARAGTFSIDYVFDGEPLLGTGGALQRALPLLGEAFFVLYGDSLLDVRPAGRSSSAFRASGRAGLMTVFRNDDKWDRSNVLFDGGPARSLRQGEPNARHAAHRLRPGRADRPGAGAVPPDRPFDLAAVYQRLLADGDLAGFEVTDRFYEIGSPEGLEETRAFLARKDATQA